MSNSSGDSDQKFPAVRPSGATDVARAVFDQLGAVHVLVTKVSERTARIEQQLSEHGRGLADVAELRDRFDAELRRVETEARDARERDRAMFESKLASEHDRLLTLRVQAVGIAALVAFVVPLALRLLH